MSNNNENKALAPFSCQFSPQVPELLLKLNCTIAISTYQAGKLVFISAKDEDSLSQLPRNFNKAMGIAEDFENQKLAVACKDEVILFKNSSELANYYPNAPNKYDALYMPRITFHTGAVDIHDLSFGLNGEIYAVNTLFSCIIKLDENYSFTPIWSPPQIDKITSEDRCHLNGMAMLNGKPKYATAFNNGNTPQSWRENITRSGVIYDIEKNKIICSGLPMPHTPRIFNNELYVLLLTKKHPNEREVDDLIFASKVCKHTKSNTIVFTKNKQLIASGVGQTSRVDALKQAVEKANNFNLDLKDSVMASDAFFPFPDCVELAKKSGITSVIQPGGSIKDNLSIEFCDENNMSMVMTGTRHFKH